MRLVVIYRSPSCTVSITNQMLKALSDLLSCNFPCLIAGDFNLPDIEWEAGSSLRATCSASRAFLQLISTHSLLQLFQTPTRGSHILDRVLTNTDSLVTDLNVGPPLGTSDHSSIQFRLFIPKNSSPSRLRSNFKGANYEAILSHLKDVDWYGSLNLVTSVDEKYELFIAILNHTIQMFVPVRKIPDNRCNLTRHLRNLFRLRSNAWFNAKASDLAVDWAKFKALNQKFSRGLKKFHSCIEKKIIKGGRKPMFYKLINSRLNSKGTIGSLIAPN